MRLSCLILSFYHFIRVERMKEYTIIFSPCSR